MPTRPSPEASAGNEVGCFPTALSAVFLLSGSIVLWAFFLQPFRLLVEALSWEKVPCTIVSSRIEPAADDSYRPDIRYKYHYKAAPYASRRVWFVKHETDTHADVKAIVSRYPEGLSTFCYVNPEDPKVAVLERGLRPGLLLAVFPLALALIGLAGLVRRLVQRVLPRRQEEPADRLPVPSRPRPPARRPAGPVTHRGRSGLRPFAAFLLLAALWNGAVSFLVREVIASWYDGLPGCHGWFLTFVAIPFVLLGLALLALAAYFFLRLFNPRPTLRISSCCAAAGSAIDISWRFSRRTSPIRRLRVYVEGREEATYRRGSRMCTDCEVFTTINLVDTTQPAEIRAGQMRFAISANAIPSFQSDHNKIAWAVRIRGEVRRWPDIDDELEITVLPPTATGGKAI
jgi:hypothetical protein